MHCNIYNNYEIGKQNTEIRISIFYSSEDNAINIFFRDLSQLYYQRKQMPNNCLCASILQLNGKQAIVNSKITNLVNFLRLHLSFVYI